MAQDINSGIYFHPLLTYFIHMLSIRRSIVGFSLIELTLAWFLLTVVLLSVYHALLQQRLNLKSMQQQLVAQVLLNNIIEQFHMSGDLQVREQQWLSWQNEIEKLLERETASKQCQGLECRICLQAVWIQPLCQNVYVVALPYWN